MTASGPANLTSFGLISLPGSNYEVSGKISGGKKDYYEFTATPISENRETLKFNVMACLHLATGASDLKQGRKDRADKGAITKEDLVCRGVG